MKTINNYNLVYAKTHIKKLRGLFGYGKNCILVLYKCSDIHTLLFRNKIDVAFFDHEGNLMMTRENLKPWSRLCKKGAYFVVERFSDMDKPWVDVLNKIDLFNKGGEYESLPCM